MLGLKRTWGWPLIRPDMGDRTLKTMRTQLLSIPVLGYPGHHNCQNLALIRTISDLLVRFPNPALESHYEHIDRVTL